MRLERTSLTLDAMGVKVEGAAAAGLPAIELLEIVSGERRRVMLPGYVIRAELLPPRDFMKEARGACPADAEFATARSRVRRQTTQRGARQWAPES